MRKRIALLTLSSLLTMSCLFTQGTARPQEHLPPTDIPQYPVKTPTIVSVGVLVYSMPFCVIADETVYLRPFPNTESYPLAVLGKGQQVFPNGPVEGEWMRVASDAGDGWVNGNFVGTCTSRPKNLYDRSENEME